MVNVIKSAGILGIDGYVVDVECDLSNGMPRFDIVGLPDAAVKESSNRVRSAIKNCGFSFPVNRITVNLAPADVKKEGSVYDLPILMGIICPQIDITPEDCAFIGELSLNGEIRPISGAISMAMALKDKGINKLFVPIGNGFEVSLAGRDMNIYPAGHVMDIIAHFTGREPIKKQEYIKESVDINTQGLDFAHVMGQENAKKALEIAAAGGHNILLSGSPGSGKSMMAKRISTILPKMTEQEHLEVIRIYSAVGQGKQAAQTLNRPFRAPHHTSSIQSLAGGSGAGKLPRPGEISLAHNGVLFLDEFPEFQKAALEVLRQPIEDGVVSISRVVGKVSYPSKFMLVCAMNPCKCGWHGHESGRCTCSAEAIARYRSRISGPIFDRIDLQVDVRPVKYEDISKRNLSESSEDIKRRVVAARKIQRERFKSTNISCNAYIDPANMKEMCTIDDDAQILLNSAFETLGLTARSYDRVLRVSRTIADLSSSEIITSEHVAQAVQYRSLDRK